MMNGVCSKCNSQTVYRKVKGIFYGGDGGHYIKTGFMNSRSDYICFICTTCGYYENYILDKKALSKVAEKWDKV